MRLGDRPSGFRSANERRVSSQSRPGVYGKILGPRIVDMAKAGRTGEWGRVESRLVARPSDDAEWMFGTRRHPRLLAWARELEEVSEPGPDQRTRTEPAVCT